MPIEDARVVDRTSDEVIHSAVCGGLPALPTASEGAPTIAETDVMPSAAAFFAEHVQTNSPLVVRGGARSWRALSWSATVLSEAHGEEIVSVAPLCTTGPHAYRDKWLEPADEWEHVEHEPETVDSTQLLVVSATRVRMRLKKFFRLLRLAAEARCADGGGADATFYADGAGNLEHSFPFLRDSHFTPPPCAASLALKRVDLWIGGRSVSRMHYDNLDNVFAQCVGHKTFVLARPADGARVQGGKRLRKARQHYAHKAGGFTREGGGVMHETVLNYLGGASRPESLPVAAVTLAPGDLLYLPFGWWHEVHGHPNAEEGLSASVSHFYTPYYCRLGGKACTVLGPLMVNPRYCPGDDDERGEGEREGLGSGEGNGKAEAEAEAVARGNGTSGTGSGFTVTMTARCKRSELPGTSLIWAVGIGATISLVAVLAAAASSRRHSGRILSR